MRMSHYKEKVRKSALVLSWGLYDLANQFFALNIVSLYFVRWVTIEKGAPEIFYSASFAISTFLVAVSAPILGTISDVTGRRRPFLVYLTLLSVIFTMLLGIYQNVFLGLLFFAIANFGCQAAIVFYNAQMVNIAPKDKIGLVSGFGRMLGYSGAILALYLTKPIVVKSGYQAAFLPTGILFLVFALPCLVFVKDKDPKRNINLVSFLKKDKIFEIIRQLKETFFDSYKFPGLPDFLKAAFFVLCAVNVIIIFMAVYATKVFGLNEVQIINLIAFSTVFAMVGSIASGYISDRIGASKSLTAIFILWGICLLAVALARTANLYWLVGSLVGVALGSIWVVLRALVIRLVPVEKIGEAFGLFNIVGYLSGVVGAIFWGVALLFLSPLGELGYRVALFSLNLFIVFGLIFLLRMNRKLSKNYLPR